MTLKNSNGGASSVRRNGNGKISPVVMFPFTAPSNFSHLEALFEHLHGVTGNHGKYYNPTVIVNEHTIRRSKDRAKLEEFLKKSIEPHCHVVRAWCVDTCQMWIDGQGAAYEISSLPGDVYWLIPGDFPYGTQAGQNVLGRLQDLPERVYSEQWDMHLGEISIDKNNSKQLIDQYGTYGLLFNWFPAEAQTIRTITDKPRTEFFAIGQNYLQFVIVEKRWYPYEQTLAILLHGVRGQEKIRRITKLELGAIEDDPQGRDSLAAAIQQVERTELMLKLFWRERHADENPTWSDEFRRLDEQSGKIRDAALIILEQSLRRR